MYKNHIYTKVGSPTQAPKHFNILIRGMVLNLVLYWVMVVVKHMVGRPSYRFGSWTLLWIMHIVFIHFFTSVSINKIQMCHDTWSHYKWMRQSNIYVGRCCRRVMIFESTNHSIHHQLKTSSSWRIRMVVIRFDPIVRIDTTSQSFRTLLLQQKQHPTIIVNKKVEWIKSKRRMNGIIINRNVKQ